MITTQVDNQNEKAVNIITTPIGDVQNSKIQEAEGDEDANENHTNDELSDTESFPEDTIFQIEVQRILHQYYECLRYEKEAGFQAHAVEREAPFTCHDTASALKIHSMEILSWGYRGRISNSKIK